LRRERRGGLWAVGMRCVAEDPLFSPVGYDLGCWADAVGGAGMAGVAGVVVLEPFLMVLLLVDDVAGVLGSETDTSGCILLDTASRWVVSHLFTTTTRRATEGKPASGCRWFLLSARPVISTPSISIPTALSCWCWGISGMRLGSGEWLASAVVVGGIGRMVIVLN